MEMNQDVVWLLRILNKVYPQQKLDDDLIRIWSVVLQELSRSEMEKAVGLYLKSDSPFFPRPGQIYSLARPEMNTEGEASLVVDKIFASVGPFGPDRIGEEKAKNKIGPIGWLYIQNCGGWGEFLKTLTDNDSLPTYKAQARKSIAGILTRQKNDQSLLPGETKVQLSALGFNLKTLPGGDNGSSQRK